MKSHLAQNVNSWGTLSGSFREDSENCVDEQHDLNLILVQEYTFCLALTAGKFCLIQS